MKSLLKSDIVVRALKTFLQAALAVAALGVFDVVDLATAQGLAVASLSAGISAVQNFIKDTL